MEMVVFYAREKSTPLSTVSFRFMERKMSSCWMGGNELFLWGKGFVDLPIFLSLFGIKIDASCREKLLRE